MILVTGNSAQQDNFAVDGGEVATLERIGGS
jgi:hypothetical protein